MARQTKSKPDKGGGEPLKPKHVEILHAGPVKDARLEEVVAEVNGVYVRGALETALAIAGVVLEKLLRGDEKRLARGEKDPQLKLLAEHPELRFPPHTLWTALAVHEQMQQLPAELAWQMPLSHHRALLGVPRVQAKVNLANRAVKQGMSSKELSKAVTIWRQRQKLPPLGRPPIDPALAAVQRLSTAALQTARALEDKPPAAKHRAVIVSKLKLTERRLQRAYEALDKSSKKPLSATKPNS